jgi:hypothetical protein
MINKRNTRERRAGDKMINKRNKGEGDQSALNSFFLPLNVFNMME